MKLSKKSMLIASVAVIAVAGGVLALNGFTPASAANTAAATGNQKETIHHGDGRGRMGGHMSGAMGGGRFGGSHLFDAFDADKDGSLTQAEVDKARKDQFDKFDANGNGKLDLKEYQALWLDAMRERMVDRFQGHDDDGNAQVTLTEFQKRFQGLIARLDENGDGKVTRQELRERFRGHGGAKER